MSESYNPMNAMTSEIADLRKEIAYLRRQLTTAREALRPFAELATYMEAHGVPLRSEWATARAVLDGEDQT